MHALEVRHPHFATLEARHIARRHNVALVVADTAGRWPAVDEDTGAIRYLRLHGSRELYTSGYTDAELEAWATRIRKWLEGGKDVYAYFDNDAHGHAPRDAVRLAALLE